MDSPNTDITDAPNTLTQWSKESVDSLLEELQQDHKDARYEYIGEKAASALRISTALRYEVGIIRSLFFVGVDFRLREDFPAAIQQFNAALEKAQIGEHKRLEAQILNQLSIVYSLLGNSIYSLELRIECYNIFQALGIESDIAYALHQIGNTYYQLGEWTLALDYLQRSADIKKGLQNEWSYATTLGSIGVVYECMGRYNDAIDCHSRALVIKEKYPQKISTAYTLHNLGKAYYHTGKTMLALEFAQRSMAIKREVGNTHALTTSLCLMARIQVAMQDYAYAQECAEEALLLAQNIHAADRICSAHEALAFVHKEARNFEQALFHQEQYCALTKQNLTEESRKRFEYLSTALGLDSARKERELERLRVQHLTQELEQKNKDLTTMSLLMAQKNEMLNKLRTQVEYMRCATGVTDTQNNAELVLLEQEISAALSSEKAWETFDQQFHAIHHEYVQKVSSLYPDLSPTELRVCAMLKINLTTKEIANLLYISVKTVEMYRFRIRKKFGLEPSVNLSTFLASI